MTPFPLTEQQIRDIAPRDAARYLRTHGWQETGSVRFSARWTLSDREATVLLPVLSDLADYPNRMGELLERLAVVENRTVLDIHGDMVLTDTDSQEIISRPATPSGTVPLIAGARAVSSIRDLLLSAATAEVLDEPRLVLPRNKPKRAKDFLGQALLGPSKAGSYVFSVRIPLGDDPQADLTASARAAARLGAAPLPPPFGRRVAQRLYRAVHAARDAAAQSMEADDLGAFELQAEHGVSADLCQALTGIGESSEDGFAVRFSWSPRWSVPHSFSAPRADFPQDLVAVLAAGADQLRASDPSPQVYPDALILGPSISLTRAKDQNGGVILVAAGPGSTPELAGHQIRIRLEPEHYDKTAAAHSRHHDLLFQGTVIKSGNSYSMEAATRIVVLAS
ncbi:hypothetical protein GCM10009760_09360 [Kitasatospora kazusensis]|uniref:Uncharacterized protein n=1 Tax=Kitasatospora kazusensis TaxID=407974 RepID=A0ABN2YWB2_9ACTN